MVGDAQKNICKYMNCYSNKKFNYFHVSTIALCIKEELKDRRKKGLIINTKTEKGKELLNKRTAKIVNDKIGTNFTKDDIRLYKRCLSQEYSDRTGRCAWGFKTMREKMGYDPDTGLEL